LVKKLTKASVETSINDIDIAGGVYANSALRQKLEDISSAYNWQLHIPKFEYTTDNAAMIAINGYFKFINKEFATLYCAPFARQTAQ